MADAPDDGACRARLVSPIITVPLSEASARHSKSAWPRIAICRNSVVRAQPSSSHASLSTPHDPTSVVEIGSAIYCALIQLSEPDTLTAKFVMEMWSGFPSAVPR